MKLVYLAAPFFNSEQEAELDRLEGVLGQVPDLKVFSPRKECRYRVGDSRAVADRAFLLNIENVVKCDLILAGLTWPDPGTAWELGLAQAHHKSRLGFTSNPKVGMNLMVRHTVNRFTLLEALLYPALWSRWMHDGSLNWFPPLPWQGEIE